MKNSDRQSYVIYKQPARNLKHTNLKYNKNL